MKREAYRRIVALLDAGSIEPDQMITQRELMALADVTLGAVREAVLRLEAEGLLETLPKRGLMVPSLDVRFVREACQLRRIFELEALSANGSDLPPPPSSSTGYRVTRPCASGSRRLGSRTSSPSSGISTGRCTSAS